MKLFGVTIDELTREAALQALARKQIIFTPNPEILLEARRNPTLRRALTAGTLMLPDGHGLQFASTLLRVRWRLLRMLLALPALFLFLFWKAPFRGVFPELIHGSDFMNDVVHYAATRRYSVFFLGGRHGAAEKTARYFTTRYPQLTVAGFSEKNPSDEALMEVKKSRAQVLFVAYGAPKQEQWLAQNAKKMPQLIHAMAVGGSFDFYSGKVKRAPRFLRAVGLEWFWRLLMNPAQRLRRIWRAVVVFPLLTMVVDGR